MLWGRLHHSGCPQVIFFVRLILIYKHNSCDFSLKRLGLWTRYISVLLERKVRTRRQNLWVEKRCYSRYIKTCCSLLIADRSRCCKNILFVRFQTHTNTNDTGSYNRTSLTHRLFLWRILHEYTRIVVKQSWHEQQISRPWKGFFILHLCLNFIIHTKSLGMSFLQSVLAIQLYCIHAFRNLKCFRRKLNKPSIGRNQLKDTVVIVIELQWNSEYRDTIILVLPWWIKASTIISQCGIPEFMESSQRGHTATNWSDCIFCSIQSWKDPESLTCLSNFSFIPNPSRAYLQLETCTPPNTPVLNP